MKIPLYKPSFTDLEKRAVLTSIEDREVSTFGRATQEFAKELEHYLDFGRPVLPTNSGTAALCLALKTTHPPRVSNKVLVPDHTYVGVANAVRMAGFEPLFADVSPDTWLMDPPSSPRLEVAAVILVSSYGYPLDLEPWRQAGYTNIIEDHAQGHFPPPDTMSEIRCFSFNGNKSITTGGGGAIQFSSTNRYIEAKFIANQASKSGVPHGTEGFNFAMPALNASLGIAQLKRLGEINTRKRAIFQRYDDALNLGRPKHKDQLPWIYAAKVSVDTNIQELRRHLLVHGIETRGGFTPLHSVFTASEFLVGDPAMSQRLFHNQIMLPSYPDLTEAEQQYIIEHFLREEKNAQWS